MPKIALLTCQRLPNLFETDQTLLPLFAEEGITATPVIWNDPLVDWKAFDLLVIRNTWDYYTQQKSFVHWLEQIKVNGINLLNPAEVVLQNMHKFYLRDFERDGVRIIPTLFSSGSSRVSLGEIVAQGWSDVVIKPAVSAGSYQTKTFQVNALSEDMLLDTLREGDWLVQPFMPEITLQGELSMIFFNGEFSHAVVKTPKEGDFRIQRQYGGKYTRVEPGASLIEVGKRIMKQIPTPLLYARVDGLVIQGEFHLMELELIEPDLYFEFGEDIKQRFVKAVKGFVDC